jgi:2-polyprenyl-6-methoxyphenol hydroxylase-like FAD-dependent oxidoreductase
MANLPILIAGGGLAGLATAIGLAGQGIDVQVLERSKDFNETGAGLQVGPNAVRALRAIGAWEAVENIVHLPPAILVRDGRNGHVLENVRLDGFARMFGAPYGVARRAALHAGLLQRARDLPTITLCTGTDVLDVQVNAGSVWASGRAGQALIGADGVHSVVRQALFPSHGTKALPFTFHRYTASLAQAGLGDAIQSVNLWMGPGWHAVHYPVDGSSLNLVAVSEGVASELPDFLPDRLQHIIESASFIGSWPALRVGNLERWANGNICLTGDAAHGTVPFLAQGAAMAFEDAAAMADVFRMKRSVHENFIAFESLRRTRCRKLDVKSLRTGGIYHWRGALATVRNLAFAVPRFSPSLQSLRWLYV